MTWFVVSIVSMVMYEQGEQSEYPVFEDYYLFSAGNRDELDRKIAERKLIIDSAGSCTYNGLPASIKCVGVRKIRSVYNEPPLSIDEDAPTDGTELTHSSYLVKSLGEAHDLASGKQVAIIYTEEN